MERNDLKNFNIGCGDQENELSASIIRNLQSKTMAPGIETGKSGAHGMGFRRPIQEVAYPKSETIEVQNGSMQSIFCIVDKYRESRPLSICASYMADVKISIICYALQAKVRMKYFENPA